MASPSDILNVDPDADDEEIKQAYRSRVKEAHPDLGGSDAEFKQVKWAYDQLTAEAAEDPLKADDFPHEHPPEPEDQPAEVDYLNYEVLEDHDWQLDDEDLFEKAAEANLDQVDYGHLTVEPDETLLEAAERSGYAWPYACRGGACANCAVAVVEGELSQLVDHILSEDLLEQGIRLSCNGSPITDEMQVVYNVKHRPDLDDLRLPPDRFEKAQASK